MMNQIQIRKEQTAELDPIRVGEMFHKSGMFPDTKSAAQCATKLIVGQGMGLNAYDSMSGLNIIQGKVCLASNLMAAAIKRHPKYDYRSECDENRCKIIFYQVEDRPGHGGPMRILGTTVFTMEDAKRAGLGGSAWQKYPSAMLFARCISKGYREHCPDALGNAPVYVEAHGEFEIPKEPQQKATMSQHEALVEIDKEEARARRGDPSDDARACDDSFNEYLDREEARRRAEAKHGRTPTHATMKAQMKAKRNGPQPEDYETELSPEIEEETWRDHVETPQGEGANLDQWLSRDAYDTNIYVREVTERQLPTGTLYIVKLDAPVADLNGPTGERMTFELTTFDTNIGQAAMELMDKVARVFYTSRENGKYNNITSITEIVIAAEPEREPEPKAKPKAKAKAKTKTKAKAHVAVSDDDIPF